MGTDGHPHLDGRPQTDRGRGHLGKDGQPTTRSAPTGLAPRTDATAAKGQISPGATTTVVHFPISETDLLAHRRERDHQREAVGGRGREAVAAVEAGGLLIDRVDEHGADPDLFSRRERSS
jgi:hypothetical protein